MDIYQHFPIRPFPAGGPRLKGFWGTKSEASAKSSFVVRQVLDLVTTRIGFHLGAFESKSAGRASCRGLGSTVVQQANRSADQAAVAESDKFWEYFFNF